MKTEVKIIERMSEPPELAVVRKGLLESLKESSHAHTLISSFLKCKKVNFCHFKPQLVQFVMAGLENSF